MPWTTSACNKHYNAHIVGLYQGLVVVPSKGSEKVNLHRFNNHSTNTACPMAGWQEEIDAEWNSDDALTRAAKTGSHNIIFLYYINLKFPFTGEWERCSLFLEVVFFCAVYFFLCRCCCSTQLHMHTTHILMICAAAAAGRRIILQKKPLHAQCIRQSLKIEPRLKKRRCTTRRLWCILHRQHIWKLLVSMNCTHSVTVHTCTAWTSIIHTYTTTYTTYIILYMPLLVCSHTALDRESQ